MALASIQTYQDVKAEYESMRSRYEKDRESYETAALANPQDPSLVARYQKLESQRMQVESLYGQVTSLRNGLAHRLDEVRMTAM